MKTTVLLFAVLTRVGAGCTPCHSDIYKAYLQTPMAQSSGRAGSGAFREKFEHAEFSDSRSAVRYRVDHARQDYFFEFDKAEGATAIHGRRPLEFFVGSGAVGRSYLFRVDGFLYQAPVSYYSSTGAWALSPGYRRYDQLYLTRPVEPECLRCHASGLQPVAGTQNGFAAEPFLENGVSCERCHGAGEAHNIVNPTRLAPDRRDSICAQCHLSGDVLVTKAGRDRQSFRPGERLFDYVTVFVWSGGSSDMKVTSHFDRLAQSACKRVSGDRLWCGSCHDPHSLPTAAEKVKLLPPEVSPMSLRERLQAANR